MPALGGLAGTSLLPIFGGSIAESPTISIVPIEGEDFTRRLLTPFSQNKLTLLLRQRYDSSIMPNLSRLGFFVSAPGKNEQDTLQSHVIH